MSDMQLQRQVENVGLQTQTKYTIKRRFWSFFERIFRVYTADGQLIMFVKHPVLRLREEFQVYGDEAQTKPLLLVKSKQAIAINFSYEVMDTQTGQVLGAVQKKGLKSIFRDKFHIFDGAGQEIGTAEEQGASIMRRIFRFLPGHHAIFVNGQQVAKIDQRFRFFTRVFDVEMVPSQMDPRFVLAVALLALIADSRREDS